MTPTFCRSIELTPEELKQLLTSVSRLGFAAGQSGRTLSNVREKIEVTIADLRKKNTLDKEKRSEISLDSKVKEVSLGKSKIER